MAERGQAAVALRRRAGRAGIGGAVAGIGEHLLARQGDLDRAAEHASRPARRRPSPDARSAWRRSRRR